MAEGEPRFEQVEIPLPEPLHGLESVTATLGIPEWWPTGARVSVVLAHGTQLDDPQLESLQHKLTARKVLTLRFAFPFVVAGKKKADPMSVLERTYIDALSILSRDPTAAPAHVFIGGKNLGAYTAAHVATRRVRAEGVFFLGYPLHKQDDPSDPRADRLYRIINPMLFIQGEKDRHCDLATLKQTLARIGAPWNLHRVPEADHSFRVPKKSGRSAEDVEAEMLATLEAWIRQTLGE
ncbi:MAG: dienelactone hydrolase family protein [Myxococcota bacterium]|nr:dienelactone hydrolase family protein [Myxococcota bacterium]